MFVTVLPEKYAILCPQFCELIRNSIGGKARYLTLIVHTSSHALIAAKGPQVDHAAVRPEHGIDRRKVQDGIEDTRF